MTKRGFSMQKMRKIVIMILLLLLTSCTMIPEYKRPDAPVPKEWPKGEAYQELKLESLQTAKSLKWNDFLIDEKLQKLVEIALKNNRDLKLSALNVERARAYYGIQRAELIPAFDLIGSGQRQRIPETFSNNNKAEITSQYSVTFGISSWEIDFFGRLRSLSEMALESYLAEEATYRAVRLSIIGAVAIAYYTYATDIENLKIAKETLKNQEENYELIKNDMKSEQPLR